MSTDGWEQRLADLGQARELREELALTAHHVLGRRGDCPCGQRGRFDCEEIADALLAGPLAPLLAALSTKQHNHTRFTNDSGATWSSCPKSCPVAIRRALDGPT